MKKTTVPVITLAVCFSLISYPQLRVSTAATVIRAAAELKTESQFRNEASRYDSAIRAISGIATARLDTPDDLKSAIAIVERERPNLKLFLSKLVILALSDSTFSGAVKKRIPNRQSAEALVKEFNADQNAVLKLDGAQSLTTQMRQRAEADAAMLRRVAERLKTAGDKIKSQGRTTLRLGTKDEFKVVRVSFNAARQPVSPPYSPAITFQGPVELALILTATLLFSAALSIAFMYGMKVVFLGAEETNNRLTRCLESAQDRQAACLSEARNLPFPLNIGAEALCVADCLVRTAACWAL